MKFRAARLLCSPNIVVLMGTWASFASFYRVSSFYQEGNPGFLKQQKEASDTQKHAQI